jgi:very-short-patch-repair endonuclease
MHSSRSQALHRSLTLRGHAAEMRGRHNAAEVALWGHLRAGSQGAWFRRQVVLLGSSIVDFYCPAARVVVEVDGGYHAEPARKRADARRDRRLVKAGYRVVRVKISDFGLARPTGLGRTFSGLGLGTPPAELMLSDVRAAVARVGEVLGAG